LASIQDKMLLENQVREFLRVLDQGSGMEIASKHLDFAKRNLVNAFDYFGEEEVTANIILFGRSRVKDKTATARDRIQEIKASMRTLLSFIDFKLGDPIAAEIISDTLSQARIALKQNMIICAVLLCRLTLEQTLRRLCDRKNIQYAQTELAGSLVQKLRKPKGIFENYVWRDIEAKLALENPVIHNDAKIDEDKVLELIIWTEKFVNQWLEGK